jgi:hypothetical protein
VKIGGQIDDCPVGRALDSYVVAVVPAIGSAEQLAGRLRERVPPILAGHDQDRVLFDLRSILPEQDAELVAGIQGKLSDGAAAPPDEPMEHVARTVQ